MSLFTLPSALSLPTHAGAALLFLVDHGIKVRVAFSCGRVIDSHPYGDTELEREALACWATACAERLATEGGSIGGVMFGCCMPLVSYHSNPVDAAAGVVSAASYYLTPEGAALVVYRAGDSVLPRSLKPI